MDNGLNIMFFYIIHEMYKLSLTFIVYKIQHFYFHVALLCYFKGS